MPKVVDHQVHREDLARRAAPYFSEHGYAGASMRKIAEHLGLSKSAIYHYFPTKEALFLACTKQVMAAFDTDVADPLCSEAENLRHLKGVLREDFATEVALTLDYLRGKTRAQIAEDEAMGVAMATYRKTVANIVGESRTDEVLASLLGELLLDYFTGR